MWSAGRLTRTVRLKEIEVMGFIDFAKQLLRRYRFLTRNTESLKYGTLLEEIRRRHSNFRFAPAGKQDISRLEQFPIPDCVVTFYRESEPDLFEGAVRLWSIRYILRENEDMIPGCEISQHGFIVIASTYCGDAICLDLGEINESGEPAVIHISHERDYTGKTAAEIRAKGEKLCDSFSEFLEVLACDRKTAFNWLDPVGREEGWVKPNLPEHRDHMSTGAVA
jgi:hypothetical protein